MSSPKSILRYSIHFLAFRLDDVIFQKGKFPTLRLKWCHKHPYTPTQTPIHPDDVIFRIGAMTSLPRGIEHPYHPPRPPYPLSMCPGAELSIVHWLKTSPISDNFKDYGFTEGPPASQVSKRILGPPSVLFQNNNLRSRSLKAANR